MSNNCTPQVQAKINDLYERKVWNPHVGILDFAFSPANGAKLQAELIGKPNGKDTKYAITYPTPVCDEPFDGTTFDCTEAGDATTMTTCDNFEGFDWLTTGWKKANVSQFRDLGSLEISDVLSFQVSQQMVKIKQAVNLAVLVSLNSAAGCIDTGVTTKVLNLINQNGAPVFNTDVDIAMDFMDAGFSQAPILIGNRQLAKYANGIKYGSANNFGLNVGAIDTFDGIFYDKNINATNTAPATPGNEVMFAILPQLVNVISWSANSGAFSTRQNSVNWDDIDLTKLMYTNNDTYIHTVLQDPSSGMLFDFDVVYDPKCKSFVWKLDTFYKVKVLNLQGCKESCFNGIIKYDICPAPASDCIVNVAP